MIAMRDKFHLIGMGYDDRVDEVGKELFHEFIVLEGNSVWDHVAHVREVSEARLAQAMYMPSVGMFPSTMILANLRVAPLQLMALGHPATTHGHAMDYVVVEDDYVGDPACFSEQLLRLPKDGMPYRAPSAMLRLQLHKGSCLPPAVPGTVRVAVAATIIKLNPGFLHTCGEIVREARVPVEFHFLVGQASGLTYPQVRNLVRRMVGEGAVVHKHQHYERYMAVIADCDLFLNPFPFGNTNGIVDTVWAGLVGVNKTGREVNEHIDEGMFTRLGFPAWMTASTRDAYKAAALRLIHDPDERAALAAEFAGPKAVEKLIFEGRPHILGERIMELWRELPRAPAMAAERQPRRPATRTVPRTILDIGANIGAFALRARQRWPEARVIAYEPLPSNLARLRRNVDPAWASIVPAAVRKEAGQQAMFLGDLFVTGGFTRGERQTIDGIQVDCVAARDLPPCDLLKIDTEGSEVEILSHMSLAGIDAIVLEFHSREDAAAIKALLNEDFACLFDEPDKAIGTLIFERKEL
jgi:FkbM family methyltransferase